MSREKETYREQLGRVLERFPNTELIPAKEAAEFVFGPGAKGRRLYELKQTPCKKVKSSWYVTPVALARWLAS